jgi:ankyrin repeat protein
MNKDTSNVATPTSNTDQIASSANRGNLDHPLVTINDDMIFGLLSFLPFEDTLRFSMTCITLWVRNQNILLNKLLKQGPSHRVIEGLYYLKEMFELDSFFVTHPPVYSRPLTAQASTVITVAHLLTCTRHLLPTIIQQDPYSYWKIATVCGLGKEVAEIFKLRSSNLYKIFDQYDRGFLDYSAIGGQLSQIEQVVVSTRVDVNNSNEPFDLAKHDPNEKAAVMAALGGHVPVLRCLKKLGYHLTREFSASPSANEPETLLTYAEMNGNKSTIAYLEKKGVNANAGKSLAFFAASSGHRKRCAELSLKRSPINDKEKDALRLTEFAILNGNLTAAIELINEHAIPKENVLVMVIIAGNAEIFWHFVENGWLKLDHRFDCGETVEHLLAQKGHLAILKTVLNDKRASHGVYAIDNAGKSILHYAAKGGRWDVYSYLLGNFDQARLPLRDANGVTIAHCAAAAGAVWFLRRLIQIDCPLLSEESADGSSILHAAAECGAPNVLIMIVEEIGIDIESLDKNANMVVHLLAQSAPQKPQYWNTLRVILERFDAQELLDVPDQAGMTLRKAIVEAGAQAYFPRHLLESNTPLLLL